MTRTASWRLTWSVLALALLVRSGTLLFTPGALATDPDSYLRLAENLLRDGCFGNGQTPTAYRPPLYPLTLCACLTLDGRAAIAVLHLAMGIATVWLVHRLGRRWGLGNYAALAAALVAVDPILLNQSSLVMTETMAALLAAVALLALGWASQRPGARRAAIAGAVLGLAVLCRPTFLIFAALAALVLPLHTDPKRKRGELRIPRLRFGLVCASTIGALVVGAGVVLAPWGFRNQVELGRPIIGTTHGGYTLLLGNNPQFYEYLRSGAWGRAWDGDEFFRQWTARLEKAQPADELAADRLAYDWAHETIRGQPATFFYSCLVRAGRLWSPLPHQTTADESPARRWARYAVAAWYLAEFALAAVGLLSIFMSFRKDATVHCPLAPAHILWPLLLAAAFTAIHTFYWSDMRMRAPLMPAVALVAAWGVAWLVENNEADHEGLVPLDTIEDSLQ